ncbi:MAG: MFS transporter [Granulosicoccaceae bacterium]
MSRLIVFVLFFIAVFLQAGAYGLTFMLPKLFQLFGANEKVVGQMLFVTAIVTLVTVYFSGHLADRFGRVATLGYACLAIALSLFLYGTSESVGVGLFAASALLGAGWGLTYTLAPVVLTRLVVVDERVRYFALLSIFVMAGFGLAPVLAAAIEAAGHPISNVFIFTSVLCVISALIFFGLIKPVRKVAENAGTELKSNLSLHIVGQLLRSSAWLPITMACIGASVFAGMNNFQTVFAEERSLDYGVFFLVYTVTVVLFRIVLARFKGGSSPYLVIAALQYIMCFSVVYFLLMPNNLPSYVSVAFLFGIGYGVSYPILVAMAANDSHEDLLPQALQLFAFAYFIGIFGFPLFAGWMIVEVGTTELLLTVAALAALEATMALLRGRRFIR